MTNLSQVKALGFDVFGTVVDWRGSVIRDAGAYCREHGIDADWARFADAWRGLYQPAMDEVRDGQRPWVNLDVLHRESLFKLALEYGLQRLQPHEMEHLNRVWHRLDPWPDSVPGLTRLKTKYTIAPMSNGNIALMVDMAKRAGLPWDVILGAEVVQHYKPQPEVYLGGAELLGIRPEELMMVAAHGNDLLAAKSCGLRTAYVYRPNEYGPDRVPARPADESAFDIVATDFEDLASQMGC